MDSTVLNMYREIHGTTHVTLVDLAAWLLSIIGEFFDTPMPEAGRATGGTV